VVALVCTLGLPAGLLTHRQLANMVVLQPIVSELGQASCSLVMEATTSSPFLIMYTMIFLKGRIAFFRRLVSVCLRKMKLVSEGPTALYRGFQNKKTESLSLPNHDFTHTLHHGRSPTITTISSQVEAPTMQTLYL
jgi:hypothetical protein